MERYHNIVKIEKTKKCLEQGELEKALIVARTINKKKIKNLSDLSILAEAYFQNKHYEEAREIFLSIYSKNKARRILAQLVHLSIKLNDVEGAEKYLDEFRKIAPKDFYYHIYRYNIDKMAGKEIDVLIADLEALKNDSYMESWAYELAKLYHKASMKDKCIEECSNIILWFGNGVYVEKAKVLKAYYRGEIDLSDIEGKECELKEEKIANQIKNILSEYELKEKEKEESLETLKEDDEDTQSKDEKEVEDSVDDIIEEYDTEETMENSVVEEKIHESTKYPMEEDELEETSGDYVKEDEIDGPIKNFIKEEKIDGSNENNVEANEVEDSIENNLKECEVEDSIDHNEKENEEEDSIENTVQENEIEDSIEKSEVENEEDGLMKSSIVGNNSDESFRNSRKKSNLEEPLLNKSELEAMKKSLLKHVNLLDKEQSDIMNNEETDEVESGENYELASKEVKEGNEVKVEDEFYRLLRKEDGVREVSVNNIETDEINSSMIFKVKPINLSLLSLDENKELSRIIHKEGIKVEQILRNYVRMQPVGKQVIECVQNIVDDGYLNANFIITGPKSSGKTYLAKSISKFMRKINRNVSSKVALIDSNKLNEIDLSSKKKQLINCSLIIERAGSLNANSIAWLLDLYKSHTNCSQIYLEDDIENMNRLLENYSELNEVFQNRIEVPNYTAEDYLGFAYDYLTEREYEIEVDAYDSLHDKLKKLLHEKREYSLDDVFSLMHNLLKNAEDRSAKQLLIQAQVGKFKDSDLLVIKEQDIDRA